ncbi:uncharacterized protein RAG0_08209 [Rhynchosporium agropyri]|uniref:Uncharacterized protein n=1 Tax=Rhynchosporium agropyri TaxID=914238 RepID=A0A1E1KSX9_9HELO|nr:uncharacterized protein RAG0_08209 [Rhynchosporium agropyri]
MNHDTDCEMDIEINQAQREGPLSSPSSPPTIEDSTMDSTILTNTRPTTSETRPTTSGSHLPASTDTSTTNLPSPVPAPQNPTSPSPSTQTLALILSDIHVSASLGIKLLRYIAHPSSSPHPLSFFLSSSSSSSFTLLCKILGLRGGQKKTNRERSALMKRLEGSLEKFKELGAGVGAEDGSRLTCRVLDDGSDEREKNGKKTQKNLTPKTAHLEKPREDIETTATPLHQIPTLLHSTIITPLTHALHAQKVPDYASLIVASEDILDRAEVFLRRGGSVARMRMGI